MSEANFGIHDWVYQISAGEQLDPSYYGIWYSRYSPSTQQRQVLGEGGWANYDLGQQAPPTIAMGGDLSQELIDKLWATQLRPTKWGHEGQVAALEGHLSDMRKIVSKELEIDL